MIGLLQVGKSQNADSLAAACRISRRTIFRDLEILKQAGVPLLYDPEQQSYSIPGTYYLPPTSFTADEALAVLTLCRELGSDERIPFYGPAQSAAIKLESSLPEPLREHIRDVSSGLHIDLEPRNRLDGSQTVFQQLLACVTRRQPAQIRYESYTENATIDTKLSPYRLLFSRRSWYVIGRSARHREVRTFNVGRFQSVQPLDETFQIPRSFSIDRYLGNAWHLISEPGPDRQIVIRFKSLVARNVAEVCWHKTQQITQNDDGSIDFHVTVSGLNEISWWILGYGDQAEVLEPPELCDLIASRAERIVESYRATSKS